MTDELEEALDEIERNPSGCARSLREQGDSLRPELAGEARQFYLGALQRGEAPAALRGAMLAALLYLWQGRRPEALECRLDVTQLGFMEATTPEAYDEVRAQALNTLAQAEEAGVAKIGIRAAILAADASFFAAQASRAPLDRIDRVGQSLHDVVEACRRWMGEEPIWFDRLVSLLAETVRHVQEAYGPSLSDEQRKELAEVARWADQHVPPQYEAGGDEQKADLIASILAELSNRFGSS